MRNMLKIAIVLLLGVFSGAVLGAPSPWDAWRTGYTSCEQGEQQYERGNYTAALSLFEKARKSYQSVRSSRPDWNQRVIAERIAECDRKIKELQRLLSAVQRRRPTAVSQKSTRPAKKIPAKKVSVVETEPVSDGSDSPEVDSAAVLELRSTLERVRGELAASRKDVIALRTKLMEAQSETAALKNDSGKRSELEREISNLMRERRISQEKYDLLAARCKNLETELSKPNTQVELLNKRIIEERALYEKENKRAVELESRLKESENMTREHRIARSAAEKVILKLKQTQNQQSGELQQLQQQLQDSAAKNRELAGELERSRKLNDELTGTIKKASADKKSVENSAIIADLKNNIAERDNRIAEFELKIPELNNTITNLNVKLKQEQLQIEAMKKEFERGHEALAKSMKDADILRRRNHTLDVDIKQLTARVTELNLRLETRNSEDFRSAVTAREACRKLEKDILALQAELVTVRSSANSSAAEITDLKRKLKAADAELQNTRRREVALAAVKEQQSVELSRLNSVAVEFDELKRNFEALSKENRENRVLLAAAKPKEQELARVKLRLLELDRLKTALSQEQQLNEELRNESRRLAGEVKILRARSSELDSAKRKMAELQGVTRELDDLKRIQKGYIGHIGKIEPQLADLKIRAGELENQLREQKAQFDQLHKQHLALNKAHDARGIELAALQNVKKRNSELDLLVSGQASEIDRLNGIFKQLQSGEESAMPPVLRRKFEELKSDAAKLAPLTEQLAKLQSEYGRFQKEHENVKKRISVLIARCEAAESSNERSKHELEQLKKLNAELAEMNRKSTEDLKQKAESQISEMKTHAGELESQLREQKASVSRLAEMKIRTDELESQLREQRAAVSRLAEMKIRTGELESQLREQKAAWEEINKKYQALNSEHNAQSGKLIALQDVNKRNFELEKRLAVQSSEIDRLNSTLKQLQSGEESLMPMEFRRKLNELRTAAAKLAPLNDQLARLGNIHETMKQQFLDRIAKLNTRCEAAEAFSERRKQELEQLRKLNAELVEMNRNYTGALQNKVEQAQLDRLNAEIAAMNKLYSEVTAERDRLNSELDAMRRGITPETSPVKITESPEELAGAGLVAERNGNIQLAIWNYKQALLADENFRSAHLRLGTILYERRDYAGALPHLSAARSVEKFNLDLSIKTARCQIELKRFGNAKNIVDILLKNHSGDYRVQMLAGLIESGSGSASIAEERLITASRLAPGKPEVYIELARLLGSSIVDRKGEAVKYYEKARALGAEPVPDLEKQLASLLDSRREMIRFLSGAATEAELGRDHGSAVWYYRKLVELKPEDFVPRLALALHRNNRSAAARETLEFNKPSRLGMAVLTIIELDSGNETGALHAARQSAGAKVPEEWQAMNMEIAKLKSLKIAPAAVSILLSGFQK